MSIISFDIGIHNLGYAVYDKNNDVLDFALFNINKKTVVDRTITVRNFIDSLYMKYQFDEVIIERQVARNVVAMELMYLISAFVSIYCENIYIIDPKQKFNILNVIYNTKNKEHKKLSINIAHSFLQNCYPSMVDKFNSYDKKDDLSDAILMLFTELYKNDSEKLKLFTGII